MNELEDLISKVLIFDVREEGNGRELLYKHLTVQALGMICVRYLNLNGGEVQYILEFLIIGYDSN